jgi:hypothetical protein
MGREAKGSARTKGTGIGEEFCEPSKGRGEGREEDIGGKGMTWGCKEGPVRCGMQKGAPGLLLRRFASAVKHVPLSLFRPGPAVPSKEKASGLWNEGSGLRNDFKLRTWPGRGLVGMPCDIPQPQPPPVHNRLKCRI